MIGATIDVNPGARVVVKYRVHDGPHAEINIGNLLICIDGHGTADEMRTIAIALLEAVAKGDLEHSQKNRAEVAA